MLNTLSGAEFSADGLYRYRLWRKWGEGKHLNIIMLNPSTADASVNDPTVARCVRFASSLGFEGLVVTNLFAYRATDPRAMKAVGDPVGKDNDAAIEREARRANTVVAAWGVHGAYRDRQAWVRALIDDVPVFCWGTTKDGHPRHPLYLRGDSALVELEPAGC